MVRKADIYFALIVSVFIHGSVLAAIEFKPNNKMRIIQNQPLAVSFYSMKEPVRKIEVEEKQQEAKPEPVMKKVARKVARKVEVQEKKELNQERLTKTTAVTDIKSKEVVADEKFRAQYEQVIAQWIKQHLRYPRVARRRGYEGTGSVKITLLPNGDVADVAIVQTTGQTILDAEILSMIDRAKPFPRFPYDYRGEDSLAFVAPIKFELR
jgi:periplasmic protein TonB